MADARFSAAVIGRIATSCLLAWICVPAASAASSCDVNAPIPPAARTFGQVYANSAWHEYKSLQEIPAGKTAQLWRDERGLAVAMIVEPGEDFWKYTRYCFDAAGQLANVGYEVRTHWAWGYLLIASVTRGELRKVSSHFIDTKTESRITSPEGAAEIAEAMKPRLYLTLAALPFASLVDLKAADLPAR